MVAASKTGAEARAAMLLCLQQSALFLDYREAFETTTGLPLVLRAAGAIKAPLQGSTRANPFCALMTQTERTCTACRQCQQQVEREAVLESKTIRCHAGLGESVVPVRVGNQILGYLHTGQVFFAHHRGGVSRSSLRMSWPTTRGPILADCRPRITGRGWSLPSNTRRSSG